MTIVPFPPQTKVDYPESDGKPMAETLKHILVITYLLDVLMNWFRDREDMYVGANNLIYYEEGLPRSSFAPDVYVIPGLDKTPRRVLKLWEEKRAPAVIFEITSRATWEQDLGDKLELYEQLGVREYFVYDVEHESLNPPLRGFRLVNNTYEKIKPDNQLGLYSNELQLALREIDDTLRLINPADGTVLRMYLVTDARTEQALERAQAAEQEIERLRAELERLRNQSQSK